ncbi:MAG TPA: polysaccharide deacetylase family protein [Terriglobales bacterium]|nr:polysaccharide deacetylase family protein [Terriglobales bacterium]
MAAFLIGAGAVAGAVAAGWHSMSPVSQLYGQTFTGLPPGSRKLALTFDDGPNDPWTPRLMEVLARLGVSATFFVIGSYVRRRPEIAKAVADAGHEIGNHTFSHPNLIFASPAAVQREISDCQLAIADAIGRQAQLFRPPFGGRRPDVLRAAAAAGLKTIMWRASSHDWSLPDAAAILGKLRKQIRGGEAILMHDGSHLGFGWDRSATIAAAGELVRRYRDQGYEFLTVGEMLRSSCADTSAGQTSLPR